MNPEGVEVKYRNFAIMSDHWESYLCNVDHNIGSILLDFGIRDHAPLPSFSELTWLDLHFNQVRSDGFPASDESEQLNKIDDAIEAAARSAGDIAYVGRSTSGGKRMYFFYSADGPCVERRLSAVLAAYSEYQFKIGSKIDSEWKAYFEYLFPDARQYHSITNGHVLRALEEHGDNHAIEREVDHWAYFENSYDRAKFIEAVSERGFRVVDESEDLENEPSYGVHLARVHAVEHNTIDAVTLELFDCAEEHLGKYDGWETTIEKGNSP